MPSTVLMPRDAGPVIPEDVVEEQGLLKSGEPPGRVACNWALFCPVERPAGAGGPLLVMAVAVVMFFMTVLL